LTEPGAGAIADDPHGAPDGGGDRPAPPPPDRKRRLDARRLRAIALALLIGSAGATAFAFLKLPLAWMLGAMVATTAASMAGLDIRMPYGFRTVMVTVLGVMLGSTFTPDLIDRVGHWAVSITGLLVYGVVAAGMVMVYLRRVARYDLVTAYLASSPGGLNPMVILARELGGDERVVALTHAARILLVVMTIPFMYRLFGDYEAAPGILPRGLGVFDLPLHEWAILGGCAVVGPLVATWIRLPAASLMGALLLSAAVHLAGWSQSAPPSVLVAAAQVVLGTSVGCRFAGATVGEVVRIVRVSIGSTVILLGMAILTGVMLQDLTGAPWFVLLLAYSPGGLAEMSMVALGIGQDVAFVATHHLFRIGFVVLLAPFVFRLLRRYWT
jgi:uncharacterized protein